MHNLSPTSSASSSYKKVRPEPINEKSLYGSVVEFLHDVVIDKVPQTFQSSTLLTNKNIIQTTQQTPSISTTITTTTATPQPSPNSTNETNNNDIKEPIDWLHFESINLNNIKIKSNFNTYANITSNILLIMGYKTGFSLWSIDLNGVATEALTVKETQITHVKLIKMDSINKLLLAKCKLIGNLHISIQIISLLSGECLNSIDYYGEILDIKSNSRLLIISGCNVNGTNQIDAFDLNNNYEHKFTINTCYTHLNSSSKFNAFAIGSRWLAFADNKFHVMFNSQGGMSTDVEQSYTATVLNTAKNISKNVVKISESIVNTVVSKTKMLQNVTTGCVDDHTTVDHGSSSNNGTLGICTIIDTIKYMKAYNSNNNCQLHNENQNWIIAHFIAHQDAPIYAIEFNHNGRLVVTADILGQYFNVYLINSNPFKCTRSNIRHIYSLYRGDTTAKVRNISFSYDSRWVAISTKRGTTHLFPINSYGGPVNSRTHSNPYVVNRASKHSRTAGFIDDDILNNSNGGKNETNTTTNNPKIRHLLEPFVIQALGQIRQPFTTPPTSTTPSSNTNLSQLTVNAVDNAVNSLANSTNLLQHDSIFVASIFADTRGYLSPEEPRDFAKNHLKPINSLFVISNVNGNLIEYVLDINVDASKTGNKRTNESPILLKIQPKAQWPLQRSIAIKEIKYKLFNDNPLLLIYKKICNLENETNKNGQTNGDQQTNDWIKMVEISTHLGPHRRLFMGPQFIFKTINTLNATTTTLSANSASVIYNNNDSSPLIDLSADIELNSLDLTKNYRSSPMPIPAYLSNNMYSTSPAQIDVGPGSYQEEMPIFNLYGTSQESLKSENGYCGSGGGSSSSGGDIIETIADAMNELSSSLSTSTSTQAITIMGNKNHQYYKQSLMSNNINLLQTTPINSYNTSNGFYIIQDHRLNGNMNGNNNIISVGSNGTSNILNGNDDDSNTSSTHSSLKSSANAPSLENIQFQDDNLN